MDPATAFQLVCGALQLIEFGVSTAGALRDISKSSNALTPGIEQLDRDAQKLREASRQIASPLQNVAQFPLTHEQTQLRQVAEDCNQSAIELVKQLDELGAGHLPKHKVLGQWWKILRKKGKIAELQARLERGRVLLDTQMLVTLCHNMDVSSVEHSDLVRQISVNEVQNSGVFKQMSRDFQANFDRIGNDIAKIISGQSEETRRMMIDMNLERQNRAEYEKLLDSLGFPTMAKRQEEIYDPYPKTYGWIFDPEKQKEPGGNYLPWLERCGGIYWISGKAGSGKSTLMNFIVQHADLRTALRVWAGDEKLLAPTFFLWRAGNPDQRSINGLLRSILYQLVEQHPRLAQTIAPTTSESRREWTVKRLMATIRALIQQCQLESLRVCLFLDGLDEFEGDGNDQTPLVQLIQELVQNDRIKAVVSSRPEPLFNEYLSAYQSLRLQDLNRKDIEEYVKGRLLEESRMQEVYASQPGDFFLLVHNVSEKAEGVFLWVRIALTDVLEGILARDTMQMLLDRLGLLSGTLDGIFEQLLDRISPVHQEKAAKYLLIEKAYRHSGTGISGPVNVLFLAMACEPKLGAEIRHLISAHQNGNTRPAVVAECIRDLQDFEASLSFFEI